MHLNHWIYRSKYIFGKYLPLRKPVDVSLELSSSCNMKCEYCYHSNPESLPFKRAIMETSTAYKIIRQAADLGVHSLKFNWKGESTLHPEFWKITKYAKTLAGGLTFIDRLTNSNFKFNNSKDEIFDGLSNQTKVKISFDSFDPRVFERQRAGGNHALTLKNIDTFYHWKKRHDTEIVIQAVRTALNKDEDIEGEALKRWPEATISIRDMVEGRVDKDLEEYVHRGRNFDDRQSCIQAHVRLIFNHEGKAYPCCPDVSESILLGDIYRSSMSDIFNGDRAINIRRRLKDKSAFNANPCASCSSFESFKGFKPNWRS